MLYRIIDATMLVVHGTTVPSDNEWLAYIATRRFHNVTRTLELVSAGGGPTVSQRRAFELTAGPTTRSAVLADSVVARCLLTVVSRVNRLHIHVFPAQALCDALAYLEVPTSRAEFLERKLAELRARLGGGDPS